jgi:hypothetical protein
MDSKRAGSNKSNKGPGLVFLVSGTFTMGKVEDDVMHDWNNAPTAANMQSFTWMRQKPIYVRFRLVESVIHH